MKTNVFFSVGIIALGAILALAGCDTGTGGTTGGTPPAAQFTTYSLDDGAGNPIVVKIGATEEAARALAPATGHYYTVTYKGSIIDQGRITVTGSGGTSTITFNSTVDTDETFTITTQADGDYTASTPIPITIPLPGGGGSTSITVPEWIDVTSLTQIAGVWKYGPITLNEKPLEGGFTEVKVRGSYESIFNTSTMVDTSTKITTYSGSGIAAAWEAIKTGIENDNDPDAGETCTFDDTTHTATEVHRDAMTEADVLSEPFQINQAGTKFRCPNEGSDEKFPGPYSIWIKQ
jgi:hypothetical protein